MEQRKAKTWLSVGKLLICVSCILEMSYSVTIAPLAPRTFASFWISKICGLAKERGFSNTRCHCLYLNVRPHTIHAQLKDLFWTVIDLSPCIRKMFDPLKGKREEHGFDNDTTVETFVGNLLKIRKMMHCCICYKSV